MFRGNVYYNNVTSTRSGIELYRSSDLISMEVCILKWTFGIKSINIVDVSLL